MAWTVIDETKVYGQWTINLTTEHRGSHGFGIDPETDRLTATVKIAETTQDWLSGYNHIFWPRSSPSLSAIRLLKPTIRDEQAVWVNSDDDTVAGVIGTLCEQTED
ncbi:hypothetical protein FND50_19280 [Rhodococcus sp. WB9]|nr:hypothetical protein FND50_19280 [Rhodococcus sp. WB9]